MCCWWSALGIKLRIQTLVFFSPISTDSCDCKESSSQSTGGGGVRGVDSTLFEDKMTLAVHICCYFVGVFYYLLPLEQLLLFTGDLQ